MSVNQLAKDINVSSFTIRQLINKKRRFKTQFRCG
ncbi:MAG: hypothetical protein DSY66_02830 [Persephonella sp.]|nr:MAG: hypothetical protein DSY66_02830 [Persephonella sp.]